MGKRNLTWIDDMDDFLIDSLLDQIHKGQKIGEVFSKRALLNVAYLVNDRFGISCDSNHIKNGGYLIKINSYRLAVISFSFLCLIITWILFVPKQIVEPLHIS